MNLATLLPCGVGRTLFALLPPLRWGLGFIAFGRVYLAVETLEG